MPFSRFAFILLFLLAACGDLPRPYQGAPGATAMRLAQPPAARIAVPPSYSTYLPNVASRPFSLAVATALQEQELPAVAEYARSGDWRLDLRIEQRGGMAIPTFTLVDPGGKEQGTEQASPVPFDTWKQGQSATLKQAAADAAPRITALLQKVEAARRQSDPNSLYNRPARVAVTAVTGAPGDGNTALSRLLRDKLGKLGQVVQESTVGVDFTVTAKVDDIAVNPKTRRIEIYWLVSNARNEEVGKIVQLNEIPAGTLDRYWGDVAVAVTDEAAGAIRDVILTQSGRR